jgi:nitroimidazol reductase NimA-like FMN-containing flavoprotein (pyridoxamine 5'-phosphate oxidase superfamily)
MGVSLSEDEAWAFMENSLTGIVTTMRRDGFPIALPVWFVVLDRTIYFRTPRSSKKIARIRHNNRVGFLAESGDRWRDLKAVSFAAEASFVEDEVLRSAVLDARSVKYRNLGSGGSNTLPAASIKHYSGEAAIVSLAPVGRIISWDNKKVRLKADETT